MKEEVILKEVKKEPLGKKEIKKDINLEEQALFGDEEE